MGGEILPFFMEKDKLKIIVRNLKLLVDALESEVYSDVESYTNYQGPKISDYDEVWDDDDGEPNYTTNLSLDYRMINDDDGDGY